MAYCSTQNHVLVLVNQFLKRFASQFYFALFMVPVLIGVTAITFFVKKEQRDIENRCIKMGLTGVFLSESNSFGTMPEIHCVSLSHSHRSCLTAGYTFVSQTMFQVSAA